MNWYEEREAARHRHAARYDADEVRAYAAQQGLGSLRPDEERAYLDDMARAVSWRAGMRVLDAGAGTGTLSAILQRVPGLEVSALEPSVAMLEALRQRSGSERMRIVHGSCDQWDDGRHFPDASFDVIGARQVVNGLFDPLAAFRHWHRWLAPRGLVVVIDGAYGRDAWQGDWAEEVDVLPLAATQSLATVPYLLDLAGFRIEAVDWMTAVNALPSTRTRRYMVVARRPATARGTDSSHQEQS
jgi:SAM-dependent methyltransferase